MLKKQQAKVLLVSMPWTSLTEPSLGLGILKTELKKNNIKCKVKHFNLFLLQYLKEKTYRDIANIFAINDFVFSQIFEKKQTKEQESIIQNNLKDLLRNKHFFHKSEYDTLEKVFNLILKLRNEIIPSFLDDCLEYIKKYKPTMVGFTCMYDQTIASLALAKKIYEWDPKILICLGGYSVYGTIGNQILKSFNYIDCIVLGAGETNITSIALTSIGKQKLSNIQNLNYRLKKGDKVYICKYKNNNNINKTPIPDYTDFVSDINELKKKYDVCITWNAVPIITSSGCWWGEKKHCTFCGINESYIKYKYKDDNIVFSEIINLKKTYKKNIYRIYDYILSRNYYDTLLPHISEYNIKKDAKEKLYFTCEIKANINEENFKSLKNANFLMVQPGIESFSTNILRKMNKGVSGIQNIYCLMLGVKYNIYIGYNILYGFPEDELDDYKQLVKTIPYLYHLFPPSSYTKIAITRDSEINKNGDKYGIEKYHHHPLYDCIFSKDFKNKYNFDMDNYCYYFEYPFNNSVALDFMYQILNKQISYWQTSKNIYLYYELNYDGIIFFDGRYKEKNIYTFDKTIAEIYLECECIITTKQKIIIKFKETYSEKQIEDTIELLITNRFIYRENDLLLGLVFNKSIYENNKKENLTRNNCFSIDKS